MKGVFLFTNSLKKIFFPSIFIFMLILTACGTSTSDSTTSSNSSNDTVLETVNVPTFNLSAGWYTGTQSVIITSATEGATIKYTIDGSDPSVSGTTYTSAVSINDTATLKAIAVKSGMNDSDIAECSYNIRRMVVAGSKKNTDKDWAIKCFDADGNEDPAWNKELVSTGEDAPLSIAVDSQNNIYVVGLTNYVEPSSGPFTATALIKKYSPDGTEISAGWNKTISLSRTSGFISAALGSDDKLFITYVHDDGTGTASCGWLRGYNSNGTEPVAAKSFPINNVRDMAVDKTNNIIYIVGSNDSKQGSFQAFKVSDFSVHFAEMTYSDSTTYTYETELRKVAVDSDLNVYIGGHYSDSLENNLWLLKKYNSSGIEVTVGWNKTFGPINDESFSTLGIDKNNNIYIEPVDATTTCFFERYNSSGTALADFNTGEYYFDRMCFDSNNNLYGSGGYFATSNLAWGLGKLNSAGTILWQKKEYESVNADENKANAIGIFN